MRSGALRWDHLRSHHSRQPSRTLLTHHETYHHEVATGYGAHCTSAPYSRVLKRKRVCWRGVGACAMNTPTICSFGSMVKLVPPKPAHIASPVEPGTTAKPSCRRTPKPR